MTLLPIIAIIYAVMALVSAVIIWFLTAADSKQMRLLASVLIGITWPISLPVALFFSLIRV
ncbi:GhoT/OrtT family toxin [Enterobacteriaceae bacterium ESL0689]|nr:GhoT/OrtT family toxin [Enterobacteriaceae bacterium ESL0689]